jgi:four helix bundle protein
MLSHEKLHVYQSAVAFHSVARRVVTALRRGNADLGDQMMRASRSAMLNIAEGAGKTSRAHQTRYYADARGSALECGACLDVMALEEIIDAELLHQGKELLERVVSMLTKMIR